MIKFNRTRNTKNYRNSINEGVGVLKVPTIPSDTIFDSAIKKEISGLSLQELFDNYIYGSDLEKYDIIEFICDKMDCESDLDMYVKTVYINGRPEVNRDNFQVYSNDIVIVFMNTINSKKYELDGQLDLDTTTGELILYMI